MYASQIIQALKRTGELLEWPTPIEMLIVGGAAGMMTGLLPETRNTVDCDIVRCMPVEALEAVIQASKQVETELSLPPDWLNSQVAQLNILPDGWHIRRVLVGTFGPLKMYAVGRLDLLATKFGANRFLDLEDIIAMKPTLEELAFVRTYLNMLRVPGRKADLDQVAGALRRLEAMEKELRHG